MFTPAGSGKTTAAINCAKALGIPFHFTGAIASEFKLTGFINAQGQIVSTEFRKAYESGGLFLFDEIDASYPQAVLAFNAALANDYMDFPDKRVERHKDFYCIAAANTFGQGADRQYIGRNQLDAASLDRFVFIDWKFDENLERELAANVDWVNFVQEVRRVIVELKIRHVVSPRASIFGAKLLANGLSRKMVEKSVIWKGLDISTINTILENLDDYEYNPEEDEEEND
jgi:cobaltochelatase CobS